MNDLLEESKNYSSENIEIIVLVYKHIKCVFRIFMLTEFEFELELPSIHFSEILFGSNFKIKLGDI